MKYAIKHVYGNDKYSMKYLKEKETKVKSLFKDIDALGLFVDNHDEARFLFENKDKVMFQNALIFSLTSHGIPFVYYGGEHLFNGGHDPLNRESLW